MELKIEYLPIRKITPYHNNARAHGNDDVQAIVNSIKEFGFDDPLGVWGDENVIIEGHGRLMAAKKLKMKEVPVIRLDHLTDEQRRAYALAHNKTAELSMWDFDLLTEELEGITDIDMSDFGFDLDSLEDEEEAEVEEVETPEPPKEPKTKPGDLYKLGEHRLICGNSTDINVIERLMDGVKADLMLTDPPYGINVVKSNGLVHGKAKGRKAKGLSDKRPTYAPIVGDDTTESARASYEMGLAYSENQIIFGGNYFTDFLPPSRCWIVWDKENTMDFADAELAWTSFDKVVKLYHFMWNGLIREGDRKVEGKERLHPTQKPVGMLADILKDFSEENNTILDCFGGSGSTLIACEQLNRKCFMSEISPAYVDVIVERWEKLTGNKAELLENTEENRG